MALAGMAEGCSTIAGADGGRVFVHLKASPSQPRMRNIIYPDPREGGKLRRTTARALHHLLSDWRRKTSTSTLRHKRFFDEIGRE